MKICVRANNRKHAHEDLWKLNGRCETLMNVFGGVRVRVSSDKTNVAYYDVNVSWTNNVNLELRNVYVSFDMRYMYV